MHAVTEAAVPGPAYVFWEDRRPGGAAGSLKVLGPSEAASASQAEPRTDWILFAAGVVLTALAFAMMLHAVPAPCALTVGPALLGPC